MKFFRELSWTKSFICLSCWTPMIHILSIWRCGVKICLREGRMTRAAPLYHILSSAMQPQAHNSRKTAWNSCLTEYYLLNVSCLAGSWNNRWIKGNWKIRKITLSGGREWELRGKYQKEPEILYYFCKKKNLKVLLGEGRERVEKAAPWCSETSLKVFQV